MNSVSCSVVEVLESRIAPAIIIANPIFDITAGIGKTDAIIDLGTIVDPGSNHRTMVELETNFTPEGESSPLVIKIELFDDKSPLTVQNFLNYINESAAKDYDGTFFHRLVSGFIIQGGGQNASAPGTNLDGNPEVHNEFIIGDPEVSNVKYTLSMAKRASEVGGGPNSATREFFINLGNNVSNLDNQNGGFTVFGRVAPESQADVDDLDDLQIINSGSNSTLPVQDYTSGTPTAVQLIQIVDARVVVKTTVGFGDYTFNVTDILDAGTLDPTSLVSATVNPGTQQLDLVFADGQTGTALIKVLIQKAGELDVVEEFTVTIKPNLLSDVTQDGFASSFTPGEPATATVKLTNSGGGVANGTVDIKLYISESNGSVSDSAGFTLVTTGLNPDRLLATMADVQVDIDSGESDDILVNYTIPADLLKDGKSYRLIAVVEASGGSTIDELFTDDNQGASDNPRKFEQAFASFTKGSPLTYQDGDGNNVTFTITGPGTGNVSLHADGSYDLNVSGTTAASKISIKLPKGVVETDLRNIFINDTIGTVSLAKVNVFGNFTASGGAKSVVLGDLGNTSGNLLLSADKTITIGAFPVSSQKTTLTFGEVHDYSLDSYMSIAAIKAESWVNEVDAENTVSTSSLGKLTITVGNFEADLLVLGNGKISTISVFGALQDATIQVNGNVSSATFGNIINSSFFAGSNGLPADSSDFTLPVVVNKLTVKGVVVDSTIAASQIKTISVTGAVSDTTFLLNGNVSSAKFGSLTRSSFFAGLAAFEKPDDVDDFELPIVISNFTVNGAFNDTVVSASQFNKVLLKGAVDGTAGSDSWGFYADLIKSYNRGGIKVLTDTVMPNYEIVIL